MVLVGNKCDRREERAVSVHEGKNYTKKFNNCLFLETSAKTDLNIDKAFEELARQIWKRDEHEDSGRKSCFLV